MEQRNNTMEIQNAFESSFNHYYQLQLVDFFLFQKIENRLQRSSLCSPYIQFQVSFFPFSLTQHPGCRFCKWPSSS